jgi:hypothetical protein
VGALPRWPEGYPDGSGAGPAGSTARWPEGINGPDPAGPTGALPTVAAFSRPLAETAQPAQRRNNQAEPAGNAPVGPAP